MLGLGFRLYPGRRGQGPGHWMAGTEGHYDCASAVALGRFPLGVHAAGVENLHDGCVHEAASGEER